MKNYIKKLLRESLLNEKLELVDWDEYVNLVANAYEKAEDFDSKIVGAWDALNESNYTLFKRLLSKVNVIFTTNDNSKVGSINILGRDFKIEFITPENEYQTQSEMKKSFEDTGILRISIDYSEHPIFSVKDNIVFRTVHDYMAHILGNHNFGAKGEIASYNRHAKMAPPSAIPALFTEVVGQACYTLKNNLFPKQKITFLKGFDYYNLGKVDDENYEIIDKTLVNKNDTKLNKPKPIDRDEPTAIKQPELELELNENKKFGKLK
jgi:hypothetical protein